MLRVSGNGRHLEGADGAPFFLLADTGWTVLHRLDRGETERYLDDRAAKAFNAVQVMGISEFNGLSEPTALGHLPFDGRDPAKPNEGYFRHVDWFVEQAANRGIVPLLLPTWGDKVGPRLWGTEEPVFTPESLRAYGRFLGGRLREAPLVWVIGGDRNPVEPEHFAAWRALADGIREAGAEQIMTFHPQHHVSSADFFHDDGWLAFNMLQSGHSGRDLPNDEMIDRDFARAPTKPCMDAEACYEDHAVNWDAGNGYFDAHDVRRASYRAVFAGGCGQTYGANGVFQFWKGEGDGDRFGVRIPWQEALDLPGSFQMRHLRALIESRPMLARVPGQDLLVSDPATGAGRVRAARADDGSYAFVYCPLGESVSVDLAKLSGEAVAASWYDPRMGSTTAAGRQATAGPTTFHPPTSGHDGDWVLVLDDAARGFALPGTTAGPNGTGSERR